MLKDLFKQLISLSENGEWSLIKDLLVKHIQGNPYKSIYVDRNDIQMTFMDSSAQLTFYTAEYVGYNKLWCNKLVLRLESMYNIEGRYLLQLDWNKDESSIQFTSEQVKITCNTEVCNYVFL